MAFWGCEVKPGKATPFVPPPEASKLHVSQACLSTKAKPGSKAALRVRVTQEGEPLLVCLLREGGTESIGIDLIFDQYTEFSVEGSASIHLTGYFMPEYEMGEEEESEEEEGAFPPGMLLGYDENGVPVLADQYDSEEDSDYETEESDEDEQLGSDADEDGDLNPRRRRVVITDVTDLEEQRNSKQSKMLPAPGAAPKKAAGAAAQFGDDDVDASDDDDEDDEGSEEDSEGELDDEEDSEEEEEASPVMVQPAAASGQKRKAQAPPSAAKQPAKKEAKAGAAATPAKQQQTPVGKQSQQGAPTPQSQQKQQQQQKEAAPASAGKPGKSTVRSFPNGFQIEDLKMGRPDAKLAKAGKKVVMKYVGKLKSNGKVFDQTKGHATFSFRLGVGEVIKGWDRGVEGMRVGDKRRLTIPPQMAYGSSGVKGTIPPNSHLLFDVELVDVK